MCSSRSPTSTRRSCSWPRSCSAIPQQGCTRCPANPLLIDHADTAAGVISAAQLDIAIASLGAVVASPLPTLARQHPQSTAGFAPVLAVGSLTFVLLMASLIVEQAGLSSRHRRRADDGAVRSARLSSVCVPGRPAAIPLQPSRGGQLARRPARRRSRSRIVARCPRGGAWRPRRWSSPIGCQIEVALRRCRRADRCSSIRRRREKSRQSSSTRVGGSAPSSTIAELAEERDLVRRSAPPPRSRWRMSGWTPSCVRTWPSSARRARGSCTRGMQQRQRHRARSPRRRTATADGARHQSAPRARPGRATRRRRSSCSTLTGRAERGDPVSYASWRAGSTRRC